MNLELVTKLKEFEHTLRLERRQLADNYKTNVLLKKEIIAEINVIDAKIVEIRDAVDNAKAAKKAYEENKNSDTLNAFYETNKKLEKLAKKYGIEYSENNTEEKELPLVENHTEEKKNHTVRNIIVGGLLLGAGFGIGSLVKNNKNVGTSIFGITQKDDTKTEEPEVKPFEVYGKFKDASNDKQVEERAQWFYDNYVSKHEGVNQISVEKIKDFIRIANGEFVKDENGNVSYNDSDIIKVSQYLCDIAAYDSLDQVDNKISFTPYAPLFVDGSLAQKGAIDLDNNMKKVVEAINANDTEAFVTAAKAWGTTVVNMFQHTNYTGEYVDVYDVDDYEKFQLYWMMYSKYSSTILEYSLHTPGQPIDICIDYCVDYNTGEWKKDSLSNIMYNINDVASDAVAVRSGHQEEYEANNLSLPENLYLFAKNYFNSKYQLEMGNSRILK